MKNGNGTLRLMQFLSLLLLSVLLGFATFFSFVAGRHLRAIVSHQDEMEQRLTQKLNELVVKQTAPVSRELGELKANVKRNSALAEQSDQTTRDISELKKKVKDVQRDVDRKAPMQKIVIVVPSQSPTEGIEVSPTPTPIVQKPNIFQHFFGE